MLQDDCVKSIGTLVRDISGVDIGEGFSPAKRGTSNSPDGKSKAVSPSKGVQNVKDMKAAASNGTRAKEYANKKKNEPILGDHNLKLVFETNKNKFCTTMGKESARDMDQFFNCERKIKEVKA